PVDEDSGHVGIVVVIVVFDLSPDLTIQKLDHRFARPPAELALHLRLEAGRCRRLGLRLAGPGGPLQATLNTQLVDLEEEAGHVGSLFSRDLGPAPSSLPLAG